MKKHTVLTVGILAGLVLGVIAGQGLIWTFDDPATKAVELPEGVLEMFYFFGDTFFIGLLKMILVPLVVSSVIVGVSSMNPRHLGRIGGLTVVYYLSTMLAAVVLGTVLVSAIAPGDPMGDGSGLGAQVLEQGQAAYEGQSEEKHAHIEAQATKGQGGVATALWASFVNITEQVVPENPFAAAAEGQLLPLIGFSLIFGISLAVVGEPARPVLAVFEGIFVVVMKLVEWILWLAPVGVFLLVAWSVARIGSDALLPALGIYMLTVVLGLLLHGLIVLPAVLWVLGRTNPYRYLVQMREALMTAFGTDSSSATLPVTMETAETEGGVSRRASRFVLPLGATVNMDGTALYEAVAVVFLFQAYGIELSMVQLTVVVITATLAGIGAAGIPSAGLVTMVIVVEAVNNSLGAGAPHLPLAAVGIILGVDRILDMCRTTVNVWGDAVGAKLISPLVPDEPEGETAVPARVPQEVVEAGH